MAPLDDPDGEEIEAPVKGPLRRYRVAPEREEAYLRLRRRGVAKRTAAREVGISHGTAYRIEDDLRRNGTSSRGRAYERPPGGRVRKLEDEEVPDPIPLDALVPAAKRALEDFGYFRQRYFGRINLPWHLDAIARMEGYRETPYKELVVVNAPPGPGKTTLFVHDYPCWLIVRDRAHRTMEGSRTKPLAMQGTRRLRRSLSRQTLAVPGDDYLRRGLATVPEAILVEDFGRFAPLVRGDELWRDDSFVVARWDEELTTEREATVEAFGFETEFVGIRAPLVVWDDLVTMKSSRTQEVRERLAEEYESEAETRLEPGGLLVLQGQRIRAGDLYRHCLDQMVPVWWDDPEAEDLLSRPVDRPEPTSEEPAQEPDDNPWMAHASEVMQVDRDTMQLVGGSHDGIRGYRPKYHHIVYPAHFEDRCQGHHRLDDPPADPTSQQGGGCLLDPRRLPWRELLAVQAQNPQKFRVLYQQEDVDPAGVLVRRSWVDGGIDPDTGESHPGCVDIWRPAVRFGEPATMPTDAPPSAKAIATLDPSGSRYWAFQSWLWEPSTEVHWLLNAIRKPMQAGELLDWDSERQRYTGLLEEQWQVSSSLGRPIRYLIVEVNVCQKWLLQYNHAVRWLRDRSVTALPHTTGRNKADEEKGVETTAPHWKHGRVRLPYHPTLGKPVADVLVNEAVVHPDGMTDDQVMAHWFLVLNAPRLFPRRSAEPTLLRRPSWLRRDPDELHPLIRRLVRSA